MQLESNQNVLHSDCTLRRLCRGSYCPALHWGFMLDLADLRKNLKDIQARLATRGETDWLNDFQGIDGTRRAAITQIENLKAKRNLLSAEVAKAKKDGEKADEAIQESRAIGASLKELEGNIDQFP